MGNKRGYRRNRKVLENSHIRFGVFTGTEGKSDQLIDEEIDELVEKFTVFTNTLDTFIKQ